MSITSMLDFQRLHETGYHIIEICPRCKTYEISPEGGLCYTCQFEIDFGEMPDPFKEVRPRKLSREDAEEIRHEYAEGGITQAELAKKWGVSRGHISNIIRRVYLV